MPILLLLLSMLMLSPSAAAAETCRFWQGGQLLGDGDCVPINRSYSGARLAFDIPGRGRIKLDLGDDDRLNGVPAAAQLDGNTVCWTTIDEFERFCLTRTTPTRPVAMGAMPEDCAIYERARLTEVTGCAVTTRRQGAERIGTVEWAPGGRTTIRAAPDGYTIDGRLARRVASPPGRGLCVQRLHDKLSLCLPPERRSDLSGPVRPPNRAQQAPTGPPSEQ